MLTGSMRKLILTMCFFAFIAIVTAVERPTFAQCETVTDAQIVSNIYGKIKADKGLASQISHINVVSINAAVKFQGWADIRKDYDKVVGFGFNTSCVRLVNVNNFLDASPPADSENRSTGGCASGTKQCGDVCIPEGDSCNITAYMSLYRILFQFDRDGELALVWSNTACRY